MALRLVDVYLPGDYDTLPPFDDEYTIIDQRTITLENDRKLIRVLLNVEDTESFVDWLHDAIDLSEDYRIIISSVEATLPQPEEPEEADHADASDESVSRISREELYQDVSDSISVTKVHYALVALSTIVAAGGMMRNSVTIVIGAMAIAQLIGPNIALALGTTLADGELLRRALRVNILGMLLGISVAALIGVLFPVDPTTPVLTVNAQVHLSDIALALAAGSAGTLSTTRGMSTILVGVTVAVALLPPVVALGLLLGGGYWESAYGAALLMVTNVVAINLASVFTFLVQGVQPMRWYEAEQAKKATRWAIAIWLTALVLLLTAIVLAKGTVL